MCKYCFIYCTGPKMNSLMTFRDGKYRRDACRCLVMAQSNILQIILIYTALHALEVKELVSPCKINVYYVLPCCLQYRVILDRMLALINYICHRTIFDCTGMNKLLYGNPLHRVYIPARIFCRVGSGFVICCLGVFGVLE